MTRALATMLGIGIMAASASAQDAAPAESCTEERAKIAELEREIEHELARRPPALGDWSRLQRGQTQADVIRILGDPGKMVRYAGFERWEYPDMLGGRVNFGDDQRVLGWRPPRGRRAR